MMAAPKHPDLSVEEYLDREILAPVKHEFLGGAVYTMAAVTNRHNAITSNALGLLGSNLRGKHCRAFNSDTKVRIELVNQTRFYYPDAMVVCQGNQEMDHYQDRPVVIVEVLSESTRRTDLGEKRDAYLAIPSLKALILAESEEPFVIIYRRGKSGGFGREEYFGLETVISLPEIEVSLALADLYDRLGFDD